MLGFINKKKIDFVKGKTLKMNCDLPGFQKTDFPNMKDLTHIEPRIVNYYHGERNIFIPITPEHLKCSVIKTIDKGKVWEKRISNKIYKDCIKDTIAIDIGANIGVHTVSMIDAVGKDGYIVAFEPQKLIKRCLNKTLKKRGNNFIISSNLVSNKNGKVIFYSDGTGRSRIPIEGDRYIKKWKKTITSTITLDKYLTELNIKSSISLIKIDVEGHEFEVLEGSKNTINKYKPIIYIEVWDKKGDHDKLISWCFNNNYNIEKISPNDYKLVSK